MIENNIENKIESRQLSKRLPTKRIPSKRTNLGTFADNEKIEFSVTIGRSIEEVFAFWRNLENFSYFMKDLKDVRMIDSTRSHWTLELESGLQIEWETEIIAELPGRMISWHSLKGSQVKIEGTVSFLKAPADLGTMVLLSLSYKIPGGRLTEIVTRMTGEDPKTLILTNLRRLKSYLETGEVPTTKGQPSGRKESFLIGQLTH